MASTEGAPIWSAENLTPFSNLIEVIADLERQQHAREVVDRRIAFEIMLDNRGEPVSDEEREKWIAVSEMKQPDLVRSTAIPNGYMMIVDRAVIEEDRKRFWLRPRFEIEPEPYHPLPIAELCAYDTPLDSEID